MPEARIFVYSKVLFHVITHNCLSHPAELGVFSLLYLCVMSVVSVMQKQLACILGRQQVFFELADDYSELMDLMRNSSLNTHFINLAREVCH